MTVRVTVESSTTRAHARRSTSPAGVQAVLLVNHSRPFSHTESRTRSSFVSIGGCALPEAVAGCDANGGRSSRVIEGVAISCTVTAAGGMPSIAKRWTTREDGLSTDTA